MKFLPSLIFALLLLSCPQAEAGLTITTIGGDTYSDATLVSSEGDLIVLKHKDGESDLKRSALTAESRRALQLPLTPELAKRDFDVRIGDLDSGLEKLQTTYEGHLTTLEEEFKKAGELEKLLAVRKEKDSFRSSKAGESFEYPKVKRLRNIYDNAREKLMRQTAADLLPILNHYAADLEELQISLTQASKIEEALAVRQKLERVQVMILSPGAALASLGIFEGTTSPTDTALTSKSLVGMTLKATTEIPFENSLGMRFVRVPITGGPSDGRQILFSIWETRVADYKAFSKENRKHSLGEADFPQEDDHPVVEIKWGDAVAFCEWLTEEEQKKGIIGKNHLYRLPTDHEWSCGVGIGEKEDATAAPASKRSGLAGVHPWGGSFPPSKVVENYHGEESRGNMSRSDQAILSGYDDGFDKTAPVGSFEPNAFGLYDLGGNVWEFCGGWFDPAPKTHRLFRGSSYAGAHAYPLLSCGRGGANEDATYPTGGFRVVLEDIDSTVATGAPTSPGNNQ